MKVNKKVTGEGENPESGFSRMAGAGDILRLDERERARLWKQIAFEAERYFRDVQNLPVSPKMEPDTIRENLDKFRFSSPVPSAAVVDFVVSRLREYQVHLANPMYFGLYNPASVTMGAAGDFLAAVFNPQLAAWSHSPFAAEVERHLIKTFGKLFGYEEERTDGTFTSGGAEANHTAMLTAITNSFPGFAARGMRSLQKQPVFYVSTQSHHSFVKSARFCGLGTDTVRHVPVDDQLKMSPDALSRMIQADLDAGFAPFLVVATAGTTSAGVIDPLAEIADIARENSLWYHVDAAWGGAAMFVPELRGYFAGMELSDSITFDAHKWMSVPMGAGVYLTKHPEILYKTCAFETPYMPRDAEGMDVKDPYMNSMQWSRRSTGLKVFMSLAAAGMPGYEAVIRHMTAMGARLREKLMAGGFGLYNRTPLPVVCFRPHGMDQMADLQAVANRIVSSGQAWISTTRLDGHGPVLRACITCFTTREDNVDRLVKLLRDQISVSRIKI